MIVKVLYFASLREKLFLSEEDVELDSGNTILDLLTHLQQRGGDWRQVLRKDSNVQAAINQEFADFDAKIKEGDEIALFPPVTGG